MAYRSMITFEYPTVVGVSLLIQRPAVRAEPFAKSVDTRLGASHEGYEPAIYDGRGCAGRHWRATFFGVPIGFCA